MPLSGTTSRIMILLAVFPTVAMAQTTISAVAINTTTPVFREKVELRFTLSQAYANPFDPAEADVRMKIVEPDGAIIEQPAFYYTEYTATGTSFQTLTNPRDVGWRARFAPRKTGNHLVSILVSDANGNAQLTNAVSFTCTGVGGRGLLKLDGRDGRFVAHEDGAPYYPIGHNQSWAGNPGTNDYATRFAAMGAAGENWSRVWNTHFFSGQSLEWTGGSYPGLGRYSLPNAWKIDRIVESAEANGIAIQLVLHHHGQFSLDVNPNWDENPYNSALGGMLAQPRDFFTNAQARELTKRRLRYTVARWGYSPSILAWELFNEVQFTQSFRTSATARANVAAWHAEMAAYLKSIDVHGHLVTTSSNENGFDAIWQLPDIDLIQVHDYGPDQVARFVDIANSLSGYGKPVFFGEYGADDITNTGQTPEQNPASQGEPAASQIVAGLPLHNNLWVGAMLPGGAMHWYWDYIEARDLYGIHAPVAAYLDGEDMAAHHPTRANVAFAGTVPVSGAFAPGITDFFGASTQTSFVISQAATVDGMNNLSRWLHGTFQNAIRSDPSFQGTFRSPATFTVRIAEVSGSGSNSIRILVDGGVVTTQSLANGATNLTVAAAVPAGTHTVQVMNNGQDWIAINQFEVTGIDGSLVNAIGLIADERAWAWFYDTGSQFRITPNGVISGQVARLAVPTPGDWQVTFHDTRGVGGIVGETTVASSAGLIEFTLPDFEGSLAIKAVVVPPTPPFTGFFVVGEPSPP